MSHTGKSPAQKCRLVGQQGHLTTLRRLSKAQLKKAWSEKPFLKLAHQVLTCLAPSPAVHSHAAPINRVFLLPAAQPLAAPQLLWLGREESQGLFFCPVPLARLCTLRGSKSGPPSWGQCCRPLLPQRPKRSLHLQIARK